jgi:glutaminase
MSAVAGKLAALQPARMGRPKKIDSVLDAEDKQAVIDRYVAGCSVRTISDDLAALGVALSDGPIIALLKEANVYRRGS